MKTIQDEIIHTLKTKPNIDPEQEFRRSVDFMKSYLKKHTFLKSLVLGLSGGQDSTLCGYMAQTAINELNEEAGSEQYQFVAVRLPYGVQMDEDDCQDAIKWIQPSVVVTVNINHTAKVQHRYCRLKELLPGRQKDIAEVVRVSHSVKKHLRGVIHRALRMIDELGNVGCVISHHFHKVNDHPSCIYHFRFS